MTTRPTKPLPLAAFPEFTKPFWDAARRRELVVQHCNTHNGFFFYPRELCPNCLSSDWTWTKVSGRGRVYTFTTVHQAENPAFSMDAPYVHAIIQLDEGARLVSNVVGCPPQDVRVNMPVVAVFEDVSPEFTLVKFKPA